MPKQSFDQSTETAKYGNRSQLFNKNAITPTHFQGHRAGNLNEHRQTTNHKVFHLKFTVTLKANYGLNK